MSDPSYRLFLTALWAFMRAHPDADFTDFEACAERAARMTGVAS